MSRDLRQYTHQTNVRLILGGILILLVVGDGLIYLLYGQSAALIGAICILAGLLPLGLIVLLLWLMEWIVKRADDH